MAPRLRSAGPVGVGPIGDGPVVDAGRAGAHAPDPRDGMQMQDAADPRTWDADEAVTRLFRAHYRPLVRLAALLTGDPGRAEELAQDAYVELHARWRRLRDTDKALAYLRQSIVNRSRSVLRRRLVSQRYADRQPPPATVPSAEHGALAAIEHAGMIEALRRLPERQREALILRYYLDLAEADIAEAMGISRGAVKSHCSRGLAALRQGWEVTS